MSFMSRSLCLGEPGECEIRDQLWPQDWSTCVCSAGGYHWGDLGGKDNHDNCDKGDNGRGVNDSSSSSIRKKLAGQSQNGLHHLCGAQVISFKFKSIFTDPDVLAGSPTTSRLSGTSPTNKTIGLLLMIVTTKSLICVNMQYKCHHFNITRTSDSGDLWNG